MKTKKQEGAQSKHQKFKVKFKVQVLDCAECDGVAKTALYLGIAESLQFKLKVKHCG